MPSDPPGGPKPSTLEKKLADLAVREGYLTRNQLNVAVSTRDATDPSVPLDVILVSLGFLEESEVEELLKTVRKGMPREIPVARPPASGDGSDDEAVQIVGSTTVMEPIGRGPSGRVYRGFHGEFRCDVAVKEIPANSLNRPFLDHFGARARRLCGLRHPNIARVLEVVERPDALFVISEMVEGITLLDHVRQNRPLEVPQAVGILRQILSALYAVHKAKAIHGNLKAENVFLTGGLQVKLTDFGLGRDEPEFLKTHADLAGGILHILAPEQWVREAVPASDLYACGVLWHFMLTGQFAFTGKGYMVTRQNHEQGIATPPSECRPGLPPAVDVVFQSLAHKDLRQRYPRIQAALADLRCVEVGMPPRGARPRPEAERPEPAPPGPGRPRAARSPSGRSAPIRRRIPPTGGGKATSR